MTKPRYNDVLFDDDDSVPSESVTRKSQRRKATSPGESRESSKDRLLILPSMGESYTEYVDSYLNLELLEREKEKHQSFLNL